MKRAFALSLLAVLGGLGLSLLGCAHFRSGPATQKFTVQREWVRSTLGREYLGYRRLNQMTPIVLTNLIVQGNGVDGIVAYDRLDGSQKWRLNIENGVEGGAQVVEDVLYFGASDGSFYAVQVETGKVLWTFPVRAEVLAAPSVVNGVVYFQTGTDVVYALDAKSGKQLWFYNRQSSSPLSVRATTRPVLEGDTLYVGFSDGFVVGLNRTDGTLRWERKLSRNNRFKDIDATPVFDGDIMYVSSFDGSLYAMRKESGQIVWEVELGGSTPVTIAEDRLYYATSSGQVVALERTSGKQLWSQPLKKGIATQPVYAKGFVFYGESEGGLVVVDALTGQQVTRFDPGHGLIARPFVSQNADEVYFVSNSANLFALKLGRVSPNEQLPWQTGARL